MRVIGPKISSLSDTSIIINSIVIESGEIILQPPDGITNAVTAKINKENVTFSKPYFFNQSKNKPFGIKKSL